MSQTPRVVIIGAGFGGLRAAKALKKAPVEVLMLDRYNYDVILNDLVVRATPDTVRCRVKSGRVIRNHTLIWAASVRVNPLADVLGLEQTRGGRLVINHDLSVPERPNVFVI